MINPVTEVLAGAIGVGLLCVVVWSGLKGTEAPDRNFSVTFVFVTVWLGFAFASVLLGDVFRAFNPWRAIARVVGGAFKLVAGQSAPAPLRYPERLGRWPAALGVIGFGWLELVYGQGGFQTVGLTPHTVAVATLVYTAYTFVAMVLFGAESGSARRVLLRLLRDVLDPGAARGAGPPARVRRALSAATKWVPSAGVGRPRSRLDRRHDLRRRR